MMTEAESGVKTSTSQGTPRTAGKTQKVGEARKVSSLRVLEGAYGPADALISDLWPPKL